MLNCKFVFVNLFPHGEFQIPEVDFALFFDKNKMSFYLGQSVHY